MRSAGPILVVIVLIGPASAEPPALDSFGDPLPDGAVLRVGTSRLHHASSIDALGFAPDGNTLAARSNDGIIRLWDVRTGKLLREWRAPQPFVSALAWSHNGQRLFG